MNTGAAHHRPQASTFRFLQIATSTPEDIYIGRVYCSQVQLFNPRPKLVSLGYSVTRATWEEGTGTTHLFGGGRKAKRNTGYLGTRGTQRRLHSAML